MTNPITSVGADMITSTDLYKVSHWLLAPPKTEYVYSYLESRGGRYPSTMLYGLQIYLKKYLMQFEQLTFGDLTEAEEFFFEVFGFNYFNREGWEILIGKYGGKLPISINAVAEGTLVPNKNILLSIESNDKKLNFLVNYLESLLFQPLWYGSTVATNGLYTKRLINHFAEMTGSTVSPFHLNDFGFRGATCKEQAGIGGSAHLVNFSGTDNTEGIKYAKKYYNANFCGGSVLATEHSETLMFGKQNEFDAYEHALKVNPKGIVSIVLDTYDYENALREGICEKFKDLILSREGKVVCRPDSGDSATMSKLTLDILWDGFGGTINSYGYKVLNPKVGAICGDLPEHDSINDVLQTITTAGYSTDNIVLGQGKILIQDVNRDQQRMAIKTSQAIVDGQIRNIKKEVKTDISKVSKAGKMKLIKDVHDEFKTVQYNEFPDEEDFLIPVFMNGKIVKEYSFDQVKENAQNFFELK